MPPSELLVDSVLDFVRTFHAEHRRGPTVREISENVGAALDTVQRSLVVLRERGDIIPNPGGRPGFILPVRKP